MSEPKDAWDKFEILAKGTLAIFVPVAIAVYGIYSEQRRTYEAEANRAAQVLIQALATREAVGADLKSKMFSTLMEHYFKRDDEARILILELIAVNFNEQFQLRPLFEEVDGSITDPVQKAQLRRVAKNVVAKEIDGILGNGGGQCDVHLSKAEVTSAPCAPVNIALLDVNDDRIRVSTRSDDKDGFDINYFDTPFADNTQINELTYSLVLLGTDPAFETARVKLVFFPRHFYSGDNRLQLDQMMGRYLEQGVKLISP